MKERNDHYGIADSCMLMLSGSALIYIRLDGKAFRFSITSQEIINVLLGFPRVQLVLIVDESKMYYVSVHHNIRQPCMFDVIVRCFVLLVIAKKKLEFFFPFISPLSVEILRYMYIYFKYAIKCGGDNEQMHMNCLTSADLFSAGLIAQMAVVFVELVHS